MAYMAMGIVVFSLTYFILVSFVKIPIENKEFVSRSLDFSNAALIWILGFYFGSSRKKENEEK